MKKRKERGKLKSNSGEENMGKMNNIQGEKRLKMNRMTRDEEEKVCVREKEEK